MVVTHDRNARVHTGRRIIDAPLDVLTKYIDWSPFFLDLELKGKYPAILTDAQFGEQASKLFTDATKLLQEIVDRRLLTATGVYGFWPANM